MSTHGGVPFGRGKHPKFESDIRPYGEEHRRRYDTQIVFEAFDRRHLNQYELGEQADEEDVEKEIERHKDDEADNLAIATLGRGMKNPVFVDQKEDNMRN